MFTVTAGVPPLEGGHRRRDCGDFMQRGQRSWQSSCSSSITSVEDIQSQAAQVQHLKGGVDEEKGGATDRR